MTTPDLLDRGREAFTRRAWTEAYVSLADADRTHPLEPGDLERLATAAYLTGHDAESADAWTRAYQVRSSARDCPGAARCAFWLAFGLLQQGERARAGAWLAQAQRVLGEEPDCVERGFLLLPAGLERFMAGDIDGAYEAFTSAAGLGRRFGDPDLVALACHGRGRARIRQGDIAGGVAFLDEAMVAVEAGGVSPLAAGEVYCSVIEGCLEVFDVRRAQEWTAALTRWCEAQPGLVPYRGQCLVRRAEILQLRGVWGDAADEARRACERFLAGPEQPATGAAFYQCAELHRLRGEFAEAEEAYRRASRYGRTPQPGLALLRLVQGQIDVAAAAIGRAVADAKSTAARSRLLPAQTEIMLAAGDAATAQRAADELASIADALDATLLRAAASQAGGAVRLAQGDAAGALPVLRQSWSQWQDVEVPYEAARVRVLIAQACGALGDRDAAAMELDAARWVFEQLGAATDLVRIEALGRPSPPPRPSRLSARELQVLRLLAAGKSNRAIASDLLISERTVERHVSNIFDKLDVSSRTAAAAFAFEHHLI